MSFAQVWRWKGRDAAVVQQLKTDPHAVAPAQGQGPPSAIPPPPDQRTADCTAPTYATDALVCGDPALLDLFERAKAARDSGQFTAVAVGAVVRWLRDQELAVHAEARLRTFADPAMSNYWHRSRLKFPTLVEQELSQNPLLEEIPVQDADQTEAKNDDSSEESPAATLDLAEPPADTQNDNQSEAPAE